MNIGRIAAILANPRIRNAVKNLEKLQGVPAQVLYDMRDDPNIDTKRPENVAILALALALREPRRCLFAILREIHAEHLEAQVLAAIPTTRNEAENGIDSH